MSSAVRIYESPRAVEWFAGWSGLRLPRAFRELAAPALALCLCAVPLSIAVSHTFLAIALLYREDYAGAGFRMLPRFDVDGRFTKAEIILLTLVLVLVTLLPVAGRHGQSAAIMNQRVEWRTRR